MEAGEREAQAIAALANYATPGNIGAILEKITDPDEVKLHFDNAGPMAIGAFSMRCAAAARMYELVKGYGNGAMGQVAKILEVSERTAARLVQYWTEILKPMLDRDGDAAVFLLEEGQWYATAIEAAPIVEKPPVELIAEATQKKAENPKFTPSMWRREIGLSGDEGTTGSPDKAIARWLKKADKFETGDGFEFAKHADRDMLNTARDAMVLMREIVDALEERFAGRTEQ